MQARYRNIFIFTGQGTQYPGMARAFYETEPEFRHWMDRLDRITCRKLPGSVVAALYNSGEGSDLGRTVVSHPALFMVQYALARTLMAAGITPDCLFGASLGEYVALALAGALSPEAVLGALVDNARILEARCRPGTMIGVSDDPGRYNREPAIHQTASLAGVVSPEQFVLSGDLPAVEQAVRYLDQTQTPFQRLPIRFGFHSPNIDPAAADWQNHLFAMAEASGGINLLAIPTVSCCTASLVTRPEPGFFWEISRQPILFRQALKSLKKELDRQNRALAPVIPVNLIDLGPGSLSAGFIRQNRIFGESARLFRLMTLFNNDIRNFDKLKEKVLTP